LYLLNIFYDIFSNYILWYLTFYIPLWISLGYSKHMETVDILDLTLAKFCTQNSEWNVVA
jgi:hypothetical protein